MVLPPATKVRYNMLRGRGLYLFTLNPEGEPAE